MFSNKQKIALHKIYRKLVMTLPMSGKPSIFVVGAQKAGTTSLHEYLCKHPQIAGGILKELHFFNKEERYLRGPSYYESLFKNLSFRPNIKFIDSTPEYMTDPIFIERLHKYRPDARLVVVLREPVARAYSAWNFYSRLPQFKNIIYDFTQMIQDEIDGIAKNKPFPSAHLGIVRYGCYYEQLNAIFKKFRNEQVLVIGSRDLNSNPVEIVRKIFNHVGVNVVDPSPWINRRRNAGSYKSIPSEAQQLLNSFYEPYNERLNSILPIFPNW